jgi:hypothetical protein
MNWAVFGPSMFGYCSGVPVVDPASTLTASRSSDGEPLDTLN